MKKYFAFFIAGLFLLSCSRDNDLNENVSQFDSGKVYLKNIVTPDNPLNPFDSAGIIHNIVLTEVINNRKDLNKDFDSFVNYSNTVYTNLYGKPEHLPTPSEINYILADSTAFFNNVMDKSYYSKDVKENFSEFMDVIESAANDDFTTYASFKELIVNFENEIISSNINLEDKTVILTLTSVARHSGYFWNQQFEHEDNYAAKGLFGKRPLWKWITVAVCDVAGGIAGGIAGSPTVVGIAGGAIAGAAGASAGAITVVDWVSPPDPAL